MQPGPGVVHGGRDATAGEAVKGGAGASGRVLTDSVAWDKPWPPPHPGLWPPGLTVLGVNEALGLTQPFV